MLIPLLLALAHPSAQEAAPAPAPARTALQVEGGHASAADLAPGEIAYVWARCRSDREVFLGWEGAGAQLLEDPLSWSTRLELPIDAAPGGTVSLRARVAPAAAEVITLSFAGAEREKQVDYALPAGGAARGLVFFFHNSDGRRGFWRRGEGLNLALTLLHHGFAVAAITSEETDAGDPGEDKFFRWNGRELDAEQNLDARNLIAARAALAAAGAVAADVPAFGLGLGNGGTFAITAAAIFDWKAAASLCGPGRRAVLAEHDVPTFWGLLEKDLTIKNLLEDAQEGKALLDARGVPADLVVRRPSPLRPERLMDRCDMDERLAQDLYATMQRLGILNEIGMLRVPGAKALDRTEQEKRNFADLHLWIGEQADMSRFQEFGAQVRACAAEHQLVADDALRIAQFFLARLTDE